MMYDGCVNSLLILALKSLSNHLKDVLVVFFIFFLFFVSCHDSSEQALPNEPALTDPVIPVVICPLAIGNTWIYVDSMLTPFGIFIDSS